MPAPPQRISTSYRLLARELDLPWPTIKEAGHAAAEFLNPVLKETASAKWKAVNWKWD